MTVFNVQEFVTLIMDSKDTSKLYFEYEKANKSNGKFYYSITAHVLTYAI